MNRYFFVIDHVRLGNGTIKCHPTGEMIADSFQKQPQERILFPPKKFIRRVLKLPIDASQYGEYT
jgi:hypothetical protein